MRARITIGIVACVAALGVAGCGDDDDETTTAPTTTEAVTGATGAADAPEGTDDVQALLETAFAGSGMSEGEATCVAEIVAPEVSGEQLEDVQDPAYVESLLQDQEDAINQCEGE